MTQFNLSFDRVEKHGVTTTEWLEHAVRIVAADEMRGGWRLSGALAIKIMDRMRRSEATREIDAAVDARIQSGLAPNEPTVCMPDGEWIEPSAEAVEYWENRVNRYQRWAMSGGGRTNFKFAEAKLEPDMRTKKSRDATFRDFEEWLSDG